MARTLLIACLLLTVCLSLATYLEPTSPSLADTRETSASLMETLLGDSRRLFAAHFLLKADAYFHSGFYPSIFDNPKGFEKAHLAKTTGNHADFDTTAKVEEEHAGSDASEGEHDHTHGESGFLGEPRDWIDRFSRHFMPSSHTHLEGEGTGTYHGDAREILPWLKLAAELDPGRIEAYTLTAYWLRTRLGQAGTAEAFLREGLRANPGDPAILFELGRLAEDAKNDPRMAANLWELALEKWREREMPKKEPDTMLFSQIVLQLAKLEDKDGHYEAAIAYWNLAKPLSPRPEEVEQRIAELKAKQLAK